MDLIVYSPLILFIFFVSNVNPEKKKKKKSDKEFIFELMNSMSNEWLVKVPSVRHQLARMPTTIDPIPRSMHSCSIMRFGLVNWWTTNDTMIIIRMIMAAQ